MFDFLQFFENKVKLNMSIIIKRNGFIKYAKLLPYKKIKRKQWAWKSFQNQ